MKDKTPSARGLSVLWWSIPIPSGSGLDISTVSASGFHLNVYRGRSLECSDITSPFKFNFLGKRFSLCRKKRENGSVTFPLFFSFSRQDEKSSACCEADTPVMEIYFSYSQSLCFGDCRSICSGLNTLWGFREELWTSKA